MANTDRPAGLKPVRYLNGAPWNGKARMYYVRSDYATALFIGDTIKSGGSADALGKYATVEASGDTGNIRGVIIGFSDQPHVAFDADNLYRKYKPASTAMYCLVVDDPDVIFEAQEDSDGNTIDADMVGLNTDILDTAGNTASGISGFELDSSDTAGGTQLRILGLVDREDNVMGTHAKWEVLINTHELKSTTGV